MAIIGEFTANGEADKREREYKIGDKINDFIDYVYENGENLKRQLFIPVGSLTEEEMELLVEKISALDMLQLKEEIGYQAALALQVAKKMQDDDDFTNALWKKVVELDKDEAGVVTYRIYAMFDFQRIMKHFVNTL